jgi:hypothetical protein
MTRTTSPHKTYAGIGARETPPAILDLIEGLASKLAREGWTLRTGLSPGADQAFHRGALRAGGRIEFYLPWREFEEAARASATALRGNHSENHFFDDELVVRGEPTADACRLASSFHPAWHGLSREERLLRSRDVHQVLGADLRDPVAFVVCWTQDGSLDGASPQAGGTGQALRVACHHRVPVFNLARPEHVRLARAGELGRIG